MASKWQPCNNNHSKNLSQVYWYIVTSLYQCLKFIIQTTKRCILIFKLQDFCLPANLLTQPLA